MWWSWEGVSQEESGWIVLKRKGVRDNCWSLVDSALERRQKNRNKHVTLSWKQWDSDTVFTSDRTTKMFLAMFLYCRFRVLLFHDQFNNNTIRYRKLKKEDFLVDIGRSNKIVLVLYCYKKNLDSNTKFWCPKCKLISKQAYVVECYTLYLAKYIMVCIILLWYLTFFN